MGRDDSHEIHADQVQAVLMLNGVPHVCLWGQWIPIKTPEPTREKPSVRPEE